MFDGSYSLSEINNGHDTGRVHPHLTFLAAPFFPSDARRTQLSIHCWRPKEDAMDITQAT